MAITTKQGNEVSCCIHVACLSFCASVVFQFHHPGEWNHSSGSAAARFFVIFHSWMFFCRQSREECTESHSMETFLPLEKISQVFRSHQSSLMQILIEHHSRIDSALILRSLPLWFRRFHNPTVVDQRTSKAAWRKVTQNILMTLKKLGTCVAERESGERERFGNPIRGAQKRWR